MKWKTKENSLKQRQRSQAGVLTEDDRDPCHDGICQFPHTVTFFFFFFFLSLFTPHLCSGIFFHRGFVCSVGLDQLRHYLTVNDPDLAGFQSIIKEWMSVRCLLLRMSFSVAAVNGKGHPSPRLYAGSPQRKEEGSEDRDR